MQFVDISSLIKWWLLIFLIGIIFLPLAFSVFKNFFDKGYIFSKILGIIIVSYSIFLLGVLRIIPFSFANSVVILIFFAALNISFIIRDKNGGLKTFLKKIKEHRTIFIFEEILFTLCFLLWCYVKSFQPDIHGLEKYMDFGILNSILRSEFFPPKDMWFTPLPINYYYFGHLVTAVLTKLSNISSNITFNFMIATIFAFTFTASFSIGANLIYMLKSQINQGVKNSKVLNLGNRKLFGILNFEFGALTGGFLTAFIVSFAGNLQTIYAFFKNYSGENPVPFWHLPFSLSTLPNNYWYPNATRFIQNTIHEFPLYSFVVSDLHGHVLDIPMVLLTIALLFSLISKSEALNSKHFENLSFKIWNLFRISSLEFRVLLLGFLLAVMYTTNAWDGIIYALLTFIVFLYLAHRSRNYTQYAILYTLILVGFFIFSYPFNHYFKPFVSGIGIVCPPEFLVRVGKLGPFIFEEAHCQKSPWWQIFTLYGFFYFWVITFIISIFRNIKLKNYTAKLKDLEKTDLFVFALILLSTILIIIPELMYAKDIYPAHYRANTMFKLVYQSFIMLSIASGYIIVRFVSQWKMVNSKWKILPLMVLGIIGLFLVFLYPYFAINSFYGNLKAQLGLDGTKYLKNLYPTDYDAIYWINKNIKGQPVILEAQGDSYTDFARISANTGLPTVLGWTVHEWLWRGTYDIPAPRITEVQTLYENTDINRTKELIKKYKIDYIFIGDLEYQKYTNLNERKFETIGKIIYKNGKTKIYKITL